MGAIPTLNMGREPHQTNTVVRKERNIAQNYIAEEKVTSYYKDIDDLRRKISCLKTLDTWNVDISKTEEVVLTYFSKSYDTCIPFVTIIIDDGLGFTIQVLHWYLPENHLLYLTNKRSMKNISVANLVKSCQNLILCNDGAQENDGCLITHAVPKSRKALATSQNEEKPLLPYDSILFKRCVDCIVLIEQSSDISQCSNCIAFDMKIKKKLEVKNKKNSEPMKPKAPISATNINRIKITLKQERLRCKQLEKEIEKIKKMFKNTKCPEIDQSMNKDLISIFNENYTSVTPFMKLFWEQQQKMFQCSKSGVRYHPMVIRYCLSLYAKSSSAYNEIRNSGILKLPSSRTLKDYKNFIKPGTGFQKGVVDNLKKSTINYTNQQRYITIMFDEMKIRSNLVFDKNNDELIGFVDLGDPEVNFSSFGDGENILATHVLIFYIRGLASNLKYCFAYFSTTGVTSTQIMPIFWEAVFILEKMCDLYVIAATADGASSNRSFFKLHHPLQFSDDVTFCYRTINLFATWRFIYFFADAPHLLKTARNCLRHSCFGKEGRCMWNHGCYLLWHHIIQIYQRDLQEGLKIIPKITDQHVYLNSYSVMTVKYAVQVLSNTMSVALEKFSPNEAKETANYCSLLDKFFDCLNVRNLDEHIKKRKPFLKPYTDLNDERFTWLTDIFIKYFNDWKENISKRNGNFTKKDKNSMFVSQQTFEGLQITTYSVIEAVRFLLGQGFSYVLTERFCQDPAEEYFSAQRQHGRRNENPDLYEFGYNDNILRIQKEVSKSSGNYRGKYVHNKSWESVTDEPIPKRKAK